MIDGTPYAALIGTDRLGEDGFFDTSKVYSDELRPYFVEDAGEPGPEPPEELLPLMVTSSVDCVSEA